MSIVLPLPIVMQHNFLQREKVAKREVTHAIVSNLYLKGVALQVAKKIAWFNVTNNFLNGTYHF